MARGSRWKLTTSSADQGSLLGILARFLKSPDIQLVPSTNRYSLAKTDGSDHEFPSTLRLENEDRSRRKFTGARALSTHRPTHTDLSPRKAIHCPLPTLIGTSPPPERQSITPPSHKLLERREREGESHNPGCRPLSLARQRPSINPKLK